MPASTVQPVFRGVSQSEIIDSLQRGEAFIRSLALGAAIDEEFDNWLARAPFESIAKAKTDKELAEAVSSSGSAYQFLRLAEIFTYHAATQPEGEGAKLHQALGAWGALSGAMTLEYRRSDAEKDLYLVRQLADKAAQGGIFTRARLWFLKNLERVTEKGETGFDVACKETAKIIAIEDDEKRAAMAESLFIGADIGDRHRMKDVLMYITKTGAAMDALPNISPFKRYGIVLEDLGDEKSFAVMQEKLDPIMPQVQAIMQPYYETGEVRMSGVGAITMDFKNSGFLFEATKPVAEALAQAFPDWKVIDYEGNPVTPAQPQPPQQGNKPGL